MLSGTDPFGEEDHVSQAFAHLTKIPRPLGTVVQVPEGINRAVMRAIEKNPDNRFSTAQEFSDALTAVISGVHPVSEVTEKGTVRMDVRTLRQAVFPQPPSSSPGIPAPTSSSSGRLLASMPSPPPSGRRLPIPELLQSSSGWPAVDPSPVPPSMSTPHERGLFPTLDRKTVFWIILAVFFAFGVLTALFIVLRRV
jgi:serine/threonine-protein kinase